MSLQHQNLWTLIKFCPFVSNGYNIRTNSHRHRLARAIYFNEIIYSFRNYINFPVNIEMLLLMSFSILILYGTCTQSFSYDFFFFRLDFVFALNKCLYFVSLCIIRTKKGIINISTRKTSLRHFPISKNCHGSSFIFPHNKSKCCFSLYYFEFILCHTKLSRSSVAM